ncbi:methyltransferase domain-containing protein [Oscillatoria sp. FACHB-1407]|uniref:methyltransferase domain-containing protein n=1 Tax=Oscillatoria sp. FACHB-1407 TaxID=2692847 RepID=UPI0016854626|nr:methyltransferase domain-containing protein [Oscillatoria sp. FACHB-1407]MBD2464228.1 methyltransferase domain-containing protein [Oscillatoria sp. FACHB-1407]
MEKKLTASNIAEVQAKFDLHWQVTMAFACQEMVGFEGKDVLDVGGILPKDFVLGYLKANSWTALETLEYAESLEKEIPDYTDVKAWIQNSEGSTAYLRDDGTFAKYSVVLSNIEDLPSQYYSRYDLIFSTATFEHLNKFPLALEKMFAALKPGGKLCSIFSPVWSAHDGHHLRTITDKRGNVFHFGNSPIPPWGHLLMRPPQLYQHLCQFTDEETAGIIIHHVYDHPSINRLFTEDYLEYIKQTKFIIEHFEPVYHGEIPPETQRQLEALYPGRKSFTNNGITIVLEKPTRVDPSFKQFDLMMTPDKIDQTKTENLEGQLEKKRILFFAPYGEWLVHHQVDAVLAIALQQRGNEVLVVGCDGVYQDCIVTARAEKYGTDQASLCQACSQAGKQLFGSLNLPHQQLREFIDLEDYQLAKEWVEALDPKDYSEAIYQDRPIGKWIISSINSYFRLSTKQELDRPDVRRVYKKYLVDGLVTYKTFCRLLETYKPDTLFLFNGRIAPYRVAFEAAQEKNIDIITHERGFIDDSFSFFDNTICLSPKSPEACVDAWKDVPLTPTELSIVKQYFSNRESGSGLNWKPFYDFQTNYAEVRQKLNIPQDAKVFTIFTSSPDELADSDDYASIADQLEFVERFIKIFSQRDEYLIIRHHPWIGGDAIHPANTDFLTFAYRQAQSTPKNVRIMMPNEQLASYALFWHTDAAIAFFSTVSIEAAARGVCTATSELSPYRKGFVHLMENTDSEQALSELVDSLLKESALLTQEQSIELLRKLYRFTYAYFFRFSTQFKAFGIKNHHLYDLRFKSLEELLPGKDLVLDRICDRVVHGTPLWEIPDRDRPTQLLEETAFLQSELDNILNTRHAVRQQSKNLSSLTNAIPVGVICLQYDGDERDEELTLAWVNRSRHLSIRRYNCSSLVWEDYPATIDAILNVLEEHKEEYFVVTNHYFQYDEAFLSSALNVLTSESATKTTGVLYGAWIANVDGNITNSVFTQANPFKTYQEAVQVLPLLQHPLGLLSLGLLRKDVLIHILRTIQEIPTIPEAAERLFALVATPEVVKVELPMMVVYSSSQTEVRDLRLAQLRLQYELKQADGQLQTHRTELERSQAQLQASQTELEQYQTALKAAQVEGGRFLYELQAAQAEIERLQASLYQMQGALEATNNKLARTENRLNTKEKTLKKVQTNLKKLRENLKQTQETITAMESSKFWKLRGKWIKLKKIFRLDSD